MASRPTTGGLRLTRPMPDFHHTGTFSPEVCRRIMQEISSDHDLLQVSRGNCWFAAIALPILYETMTIALVQSTDPSSNPALKRVLLSPQALERLEEGHNRTSDLLFGAVRTYKTSDEYGWEHTKHLVVTGFSLQEVPEDCYGDEFESLPQKQKWLLSKLKQNGLKTFRWEAGRSCPWSVITKLLREQRQLQSIEIGHFQQVLYSINANWLVSRICNLSPSLKCLRIGLGVPHLLMTDHLSRALLHQCLDRPSSLRKLTITPANTDASAIELFQLPDDKQDSEAMKCLKLSHVCIPQDPFQHILDVAKLKVLRLNDCLGETEVLLQMSHAVGHLGLQLRLEHFELTGGLRYCPHDPRINEFLKCFQGLVTLVVTPTGAYHDLADPISTPTPSPDALSYHANTLLELQLCAAKHEGAFVPHEILPQIVRCRSLRKLSIIMPSGVRAKDAKAMREDFLSFAASIPVPECAAVEGAMDLDLFENPQQLPDLKSLSLVLTSPLLGVRKQFQMSQKMKNIFVGKAKFVPRTGWWEGTMTWVRA